MNKYDVLGIVGEGAYGYVYKAKNKDHGNFGMHNSQDYLITTSHLSFSQLIVK